MNRQQLIQSFLLPRCTFVGSVYLLFALCFQSFITVTPFRMLLSALFTLAGLASLTTAGYVLEDDYESNSFFSMFDFFTVRLYQLLAALMLIMPGRRPYTWIRYICRSSYGPK